MKELSKYQQVAKRGLELEENFNLKMGSFCSNGWKHTRGDHECSTSFCFAGYLALEDNYPEKYRTSRKFFDYYDYSMDLIEVCGDGWDFLFSQGWPDSFEALKKRCAYVLEHDHCPVRTTWEDYWGYYG